MTQTVPYLEKKIKEIAFSKLRKEWEDLYNYLNTNKLSNKIIIGGHHLVDYNFGCISGYLPLDEKTLKVPTSRVGTDTTLESTLLARLAELEKEETKSIIDKLSNLEYLFKGQ